MPIFSWGAHTSLFLKGLVIEFKISLDKKNGPFNLKTGQKQKILFMCQMPSFFQQNVSFFSWGYTELLDKSTYWKENEHCH